MKERLPAILLLFFASLTFQACVTVAPQLEKGKRNTPEGYATEPAVPLGVATNETTSQQLGYAKNQGQAAEEALHYLINHATGAEMSAGPYQIGLVLEKPKDWYENRGGQDQFHSSDGNAFLGVAVRDAYDGRLIPGLTVKASILDESGNTVTEKELPFGVHPLLNRYGANIDFPAGGDYSLKIEVDPAPFWRHDPVNGDRYSDTVTAVFNKRNIAPEEFTDPVRDENKEEWMPLAKAQGNAIKRAIDAMIAKTAMDGEEIKYGPYLLTYAVEYAEGYWHFVDGKLRYNIRVEQSAEKNAHVEVAVFDAKTGRMIPGFDVETTFFRDGQKTDTVKPTFMWHPWLYHYGENFRVPKSGKYELQVHTSAPGIRRYGEFGKQFNSGIDQRFTDVDVQTGQK
ncbi:MAG: hypothetical protein WBV11_09820 [Salegentibacter sp.]